MVVGRLLRPLAARGGTSLGRRLVALVVSGVVRRAPAESVAHGAECRQCRSALALAPRASRFVGIRAGQTRIGPPGPRAGLGGAPPPLRRALLASLVFVPARLVSAGWAHVRLSAARARLSRAARSAPDARLLSSVLGATRSSSLPSRPSCLFMR